MIDVGRPRGPDFLIIGAQRAGTTWLHRVLRRHPGLWLPPVKELHYFDKLTSGVATGRERLRRASMSGRYCLDPWHLQYLLGRPSDEWYARLFHKAQQRGRVAGEITPAYSTLDEAMLWRMRSINSDIRLIFVMRDPLDRAWSAVMNNFRSWRDGAITLERALARAQSSAFSSRSAYTETIRRLEAVFPDRQLHFCFFDHLRDNPETFAATVLRFLGVAPGDVRKLVRQQAVNAAGGSKPVLREFELEMAKLYAPMIEALCERFEGPPHHWRAHCNRLLTRGR